MSTQLSDEEKFIKNFQEYHDGFIGKEMANVSWLYLQGACDSRMCYTITEYPCVKIRFRDGMEKKITEFCGIPCTINDFCITWTGINALDFLDKVYNGIVFDPVKKYNQIKKDLYPHSFKWAKTDPNALAPSKNRLSDTGYDLHVIKKVSVKNGVYFYDTGIKVNPPYGYYFDLVGRSSISKTGWMIANNIGIIDASYRGSIVVALVRVVPDAPEIEVPMKLVQLIPRKLEIMEMIEVDELDDTSRGDSGGLGSNQFMTKTT